VSCIEQSLKISSISFSVIFLPSSAYFRSSIYLKRLSQRSRMSSLSFRMRSNLVISFNFSWVLSIVSTSNLSFFSSKTPSFFYYSTIACYFLITSAMILEFLIRSRYLCCSLSVISFYAFSNSILSYATSSSLLRRD
jgi:hypothetical protein